jgi:hypothetical protein
MAKDFQEQENGKFGAKVVEWYPAKKLRFDTTFVTIIGSDLSDNKGSPLILGCDDASCPPPQS